MLINIDFDFQAEVNGRRQGDACPRIMQSDSGKLNWAKEKDSDRHSSTLQEYHRILWSKPLPNGEMFELKKADQNRLHHSSHLGKFILSSDRATTMTFARPKGLIDVVSHLPERRLDVFARLSDSIGGTIVWPARQIDRLPTINQARGMSKLIADRLDLTVECVRRYYSNEDSPLYKTFIRYAAFFDLFSDFKGWADFFLLQDMVNNDYSRVLVAQPFSGFGVSPVPSSVEEYISYMEHTSDLVRKRNERINKWQALNKAKVLTMLDKTA